MHPYPIEAHRAPDLPVPVDEPMPEPAHPHHPPVPNPEGDPPVPDHNPTIEPALKH
ncbi:hypothetical protein [Zemynaea arenosa]|uniref:hypothetical protein n=1 Tax=Zemynaea arenosa TaxID=2561931 RepID=UPI0014306A4E|nr:hypothetical protein [Massilia arenosa]